MKFDFRSDPILGPAYDYWRDKRGARTMPRRRDIDPTEIPGLLPHLQITELVEGGTRIRYRLVGTAICEAYGSELTGKYFDEIFSGERLRYIIERYATLRAERQPMLVCNRYLSARGIRLICNRILLPLSEDDVTVTQCLTAMTFRFPGEAYQWAGQWFGKDGNFDFAQSYSETVADSPAPAASGAL